MAACKRAAAAMDYHAAAGTTCKRRRIGSTEDYEVISYLGEGAYGVVVKARHHATGKAVAMKFVRATHGKEEPAGVPELLQEACFLATCRANPFVVDYYGMARDPSTSDPCLVMEYVGPSLRKVLQDTPRQDPPFPEDAVKAVMWQLLMGAKMMHESHIVHRDIKPGNILVCGDGKVFKFCDFGLAMATPAEPSYELPGTPSYMAPDILLGKRDYDERIDSWSLGCVMAELITRTTLFEGRSEMGQIHKIFSVLGMPDDRTWPAFRSLPIAASVPSALMPRRNRLRELFPEERLSQNGFDVLSGLLTANPDERLTAADALQLPWFADIVDAPDADAANTDVPALPRKKELLIIPLERRIAPWM